jgi:hypothetical protein
MKNLKIILSSLLTALVLSCNCTYATSTQPGNIAVNATVATASCTINSPALSFFITDTSTNPPLAGMTPALIQVNCSVPSPFALSINSNTSHLVNGAGTSGATHDCSPTSNFRCMAPSGQTISSSNALVYQLLYPPSANGPAWNNIGTNSIASCTPGTSDSSQVCYGKIMTATTETVSVSGILVSAPGAGSVASSYSDQVGLTIYY